MSSPLINLNDDSMFTNPSSGGGKRRGIQAPVEPVTQPKISLNDDNLFYKNKESADQDVVLSRYRSMYGYDKPTEATQPKRGILDSIDDTITSVAGTNKADPNEIDAAGVERVKAEARAQQAEIAARRSELGTDDKSRGYGMKTFDSAAAGLANVVGATAEYVGRQTGIKTIEELGKKAQVDAAALTPEDQDLLQKVVGGVASTLPIMAGGLAAGVGATALGAGAGVARLVGAGAAAALEAPSIGQEAFEGALKNTGNEAVAERQGYKAVAYNLPLSFITNKLGFFADKGGRIAQAGKSVLAEGGQEGSQKALTNIMGYEPTGKGVAEEALIGGISGGIVKGVTYRGDSAETSKPGDVSGEIINKPPSQGKPAPAGGGDDRIEGSELPPLTWMEVNQTVQTKPALLAVMSQDAKTDEERELIAKAIARSEVGDQVEEALKDGKLLADTRQELASDVGQAFMADLQASMPMYAEGIPPAGTYKVPSPKEGLFKSWDELWDNEGYQQQVNEESEQIKAEKAAEQIQVRKPAAAPTSAVENVVEEDANREEVDPAEQFEASAVAQGIAVRKDEPKGPDVAAMTTPDGTVIPLDEKNRPGYEADFSQRGAEIRGLTNPAVRESAMQNAMSEMQKIGFTADESREILNRETPANVVTGREGTFENLSKTMSVEFGEPLENFKQTKAPTYFNRIGNLFGVNVVAYNYTGKSPAIRKKAGRYMANANGRGTVLLNLTAADNAGLFVLGHEVFHDLERRFPLQAKQLALEIKSYLSSTAQARYRQFYESKGQAEKTDSEIAADVMGTMFTDRGFWQQLGQRNPSLLDRILQVLDTILASFRSNAESSRQQIGKEIAQFEKVRDMMAEFASQGVQQTASGKGKPALPAQVSEMDEMPSKPADDAKALERVMELARQGNIPAAARAFKEAGLYAKGFGSFVDIQRMATQAGQDAAPAAQKAKAAPTPAATQEKAPAPVLTATTPDGRTVRVDERKRYGEYVNKDGQVVSNPNAVQVARTDETPVTDDQEGMTFVSRPAPAKRKPEPTAPSQTATQPREQMRLSFGPRPSTDTPQMTRLRDRLDKLVKSASSIKFFQDTIVGLEQQIADIESKIKALDKIEVDGKTFTAINDDDEAPGLWGIYDMNAYDRFADGFVADKPSTRQELLAARRQLAEELTKVRENSIAAKARLFKQSISRLADGMMTAVRSAMAGGMPEADARAVFNDYYKALSFRETRATELAETVGDLPAADAQSDMFDGLRVAMGFVSDYRNKLLSASDLSGYIDQGLRDGDFSYQDVTDAFRAFKLDIPRGVLDVSNQLAMRKTLATHLQEVGHSTASRMEWLTSMDKVLSVNPGARSRFTAEELALHQNVFAKREELRKRRKVDEATVAADNADDAFPALLFNNYSLDETSRDKTLNKWLQGNGREAWFQDVAFALRSRPDLSGEILTNLGDDRAAFDAWVQQKKDAIANESKVLAKAPAFAELRNMDYAETILTSQPARDLGGQVVTEDTSPSDLERLYVTVANSELTELPSVLDAVAKVRALMTSGIDMETGEIYQSQAEAEAAAAEYIDSVYQNAMMVEPPRSNIGARYEGDVGFGMTVEMAGERDRGLAEQTFETDQSLEELQNAGLVTEADVEGMSSLTAPVDEEADIESETAGSQDELASERTERSPRPVNVPSSLLGGEQYRFRKGFYQGNLVPAVVAEQLGKIASRWAGAPHIHVVPNVQSLPAELREKVMAKLGDNKFAKGLYFNGEAFVFTDHVESLADAEFTLFHEVQGHYGMRAFMGADFDAYLERLYKTNPDVRRAAQARMAEESMGRLEAVDEVLSDMQANGQNSGFFQAYIGKVIAGLRKIGMERVANWLSTKGDFEVAYLLRGAKQAVRRGDRPFQGAPDDMRFATTRTPYELFSAKGGKTVAYARYNPVLDRWSLFTATGDDLRKGFNTTIEPDYEKLVATMRKMGRIERRTRSGVYIDNKIPSDLAKIPDFRILAEDVNFTSKEGLKAAWSLVKRNAAIWYQNEYIPVFEVVNHLERSGKINEAFDVRPDLEGLYERRTGAKLEKYRKQFEKPLMKLVEQFGKEGGNTTLAEAFPGLNLKDARLGNLSLLDAYLGARHAAERNAQIARANPNQPDGGSGIFTSDGDAILNAMAKQPYANTLSEMTVVLQDISAVKLEEMYESGMIGTEELKARSQYDFYVNLSGVNENIDQFDNPVILAGGPKFGTRKDRRAMGRGDAASDILIRTLQSFEAAVIHAEKNKVKQKVLAMFEINYDPDFVVVNKMATVRKMDENGQVTEATDERYIQNRDVMVVHVKGKPITMEFKQKGPGSFAEAINGMIWPPEATSLFQRFSGRANQLMGQMLTTWNPAWTAVNYARDLQNLYFNAVTEGRITKDMAKQMVKLQPQAIKAAFHLATDGKRGHSVDQSVLDAYVEMREAGGATSFLNLRGLENQVQDLERLMNPAKPGTFKDVALKMADFVESINIPMEMAPRIAAFKVMRDNGYSAQEAARFAGDITVNFNMRGSSKFMRNMFLFFNPAVQGTNKMYRLARENPKTMTKIALGMTAAGFMANIIARALGGEDDDGIDKLDKVPTFKRATSIVLWPDMPGMAIPIPYGWNVFYAAGTFMADTLWAGSQSASTTMKRIATTAFESFSPLGGALMDASSPGVGVMKAVTPTVLSPLVDLVLNENRFGAPIAKEASMFGGGKRADAYMNFDSASPISTATFRGLNKLTGGDRVNSGAIDVNPGAFDYLVNGYLPGIAAEAYKFASWSVRKAQGYDTKDAAIPIVDRLTAKVPEGYNFGMLRRAETFIKTKADDYELNKDSRAAILKEYPNLGTAKSIIAAADNQIGQIRQARNAIESSEMSDERKVQMYNLSREREKEIVARSVKLLLQTNPQMREVLLAND